eukprot:4639625-Amphidinium_carterae.1
MGKTKFEEEGTKNASWPAKERISSLKRPKIPSGWTQEPQKTAKETEEEPEVIEEEAGLQMRIPVIQQPLRESSKNIVATKCFRLHMFLFYLARTDRRVQLVALMVV